MLTANHSKFSKFLFDLYIYPLLKRNFYAINLIGDIPNTNPEYPIIIAPNHSSWWDGFFLYLLNEKFFKRKFFIMILESSLEKYSFFRKLGGYSINQESPKSIVKSLNYTVEQMTDNQQSFFTIFPQGILLPPFISKYNFGKGIDRIVENYHGKVNLIFLSINIFFLKEEKPEVFFNFSENIIVDKYNFNSIREFEGIYLHLNNEIQTQIIQDKKGLTISYGKKSISELSKNFFNISTKL